MIEYLTLCGVLTSIALQLLALSKLGALTENATAQSEALAEAVKRLPKTRSRKEQSPDGT